MDRLSEFRNRMRGAATACTARCVIALTACCVLAACSDDTTDNAGRLPDGQYPMTFTTSVDGLTATRAAGTADGAWTATDRIAVRAGNASTAGEVKEYTPSTINGNSATLTSATPFYWQTSAETKTVSAWYCGDGSTASGGSNATAVPALWAVQADQSVTSSANASDAYQQSDFLYAAEKKIKFGDANKSLPFAHQTARVVINIKKGEAATDANVISKVIIGYDNNLALSGAYTAPAQGSSAATGTWKTSSGSTMGTITPKVITTPSGNSDILKTYAALVIPQDMAGKKFIAITLTDGNTYYYTPTSTDADLKSGNQYTYDITVKHGYLDVVTAETDGAWGNGTSTSVTSKILAEHFTADDLKIGDYYYSDGKTSDGGYRKYTDGSFVVLDIKPVLTDPSTGIERTCIGIVYWVGDPTKPLRNRADQNLQGDKTLAKEHPNCTHGLVVSLDEVGDDGDGIHWQASKTSVQDWLKSNRSGDFLSVQSGYGASDPLNNIQGYNNTKAIEAFNESSDNSGNQVYVVQKVVEYRDEVPAPAASSGWYVPSEKELTLLCGTDVDNIYTNNSGGTANRDLINSKLKLISGATTLSSSSGYWSSTEGSGSNAFYVRFYDGLVNLNRKDGNSCRVRFSFAF